MKLISQAFVIAAIFLLVVTQKEDKRTARVQNVCPHFTWRCSFVSLP